MQTLDLQRSSLRLGLYDKISKFMPVKLGKVCILPTVSSKSVHKPRFYEKRGKS